jgi:hypothetical protein
MTIENQEQSSKSRSFIDSQNRHLLLALVLGFAYHGALLPYTYKRTYDAFVHIFLGTIMLVHGLIHGTHVGIPALPSPAIPPALNKPSACYQRLSVWNMVLSSPRYSLCFCALSVSIASQKFGSMKKRPDMPPCYSFSLPALPKLSMFLVNCPQLSL